MITGGAGYVGSVVIPQLIKDGHKVKCLDRFFFGKDYLSQDKFSKNLELIQDDIRWFDSNILDNVDVVLDLAAISNDPAGDLNPEKTFEINHLGRARVAKLSKEKGVKKYILASSASIYGQQETIANEESEVKPLTAYSKANRKAEMDNIPLNDENFSVTALRFSSVYGFSPRMRFDTAINCMVLDLFKNKKISVHGKSNKRPFVHIKDVVRSYQAVINAPTEKIQGQIFNIGSEDQNFEMGILAQEIVKHSGIDCEIELSDTNDHRSYFASFDKIKNAIGFTTQHSVSEGVKEIYDELVSGRLTDTVKTRTVEWYKKLLSDQELAKEYFINEKIL
ncbi:UDP-glucose 4-epimerase protein [Marine Group I thaumarchaeote SCGC AAA799-P11]|uniref:UDP-glucose 4-epimerase protein n=1 Tax=Marine Group I thaumarchaeote SCGC AAA799-P11 TaxID=1502295 RepID=A0A087S319_9ARCH|nr:UDP-glucose 4-epimerase protein [Marine Group I thaumarchaeote SCGC AAA799-P11]